MEDPFVETTPNRKNGQNGQNGRQLPRVSEHLQEELGRARRSITRNRDALRAAIELLPTVSTSSLELSPGRGKQVNTTYVPSASIEKGETVVIKIECKSKDFMKHLQRHSRKGDLARVLKSFSHRPYFALNETLRLSPDSNSLFQPMVTRSDKFAMSWESILGTKAFLMSGRGGGKAKRKGGIAVVGGVIVVDNTLYGLSVGHYNLGPQPVWEDSSPLEELSPSKLARIQSFITGKPEIETEDTQYSMVGTVVGSLYSSDEHPTKFHDWALVELTLDLPHLNSLRRLPGKKEVKAPPTDVIITDIFNEQDFAKSMEIHNTTRIACSVITKQAVIVGELSSGCTTISLNIESSRNASAEVLVVHLYEILPRASAGSWVIVEEKLLGTVIAAADNPPRAFVLPIEDTFQSIKGHLHATRVSLPSRAESGIFKLRRLRQVSRWLKPDESDAGSSLLELELLLAQRQTELSPSRANRVAPGTGWVGASRQEAFGSPATFLADNKVLFKSRSVPEGVTQNTVRSLLLLGRIFPVDPGFRVAMREWLSSRDPEDEIDDTMVNELLLTESGENLLGLIVVLRMLVHFTIDQQDRHAVWLMNLFMSLIKDLKFPPSLIPSARQILIFVHLILRNLADPLLKTFYLNIERDDGSSALVSLYEKVVTSSGVRMTSPSPRGFHVSDHSMLSDRPTWSDLHSSNSGPLKPTLMSRLLLQLSDVAHSKGSTVLVCAGDQEPLVIGWIAGHIFGLTTERREISDGKWKRVSAYPDAASFSQGPDVYVFSGQETEISEVLDRNSMSQL